MSSKHDEPEVEPWDVAELPLDLQRAFGAYRKLTPDAQASAALLRSLLGTRTEAARSVGWGRKRLYLVVLAIVGILLTTELTREHGSAVTVPAPAASPMAAPVPPTVLAAPQREPVVPLSVQTNSQTDTRAASVRSVPVARERAAGKRGGPRVSVLQPEPRASAAQLAPQQELAILVRAKQVMASDAMLALALTDEHQARFPHGTFAEEREVLAIESLTRTGQPERARDRAALFRAQYPSSPHRDRLQVVLQGH